MLLSFHSRQYPPLKANSLKAVLRFLLKRQFFLSVHENVMQIGAVQQWCHPRKGSVQAPTLKIAFCHSLAAYSSVTTSGKQQA